MRFLKTRIGIILITLVLCVSLFGGITYAAGSFVKPLPASGKIIANNLQVYSDAAGTIPLATLNLGDVNEQRNYTVYVKSNRSLAGITVSSDLEVTLGTISGGIARAVNKDVIESLIITFNPQSIVGEDAVINPTINITCSY